MSLADGGFLILLRAIAIVNILYGIPFILRLIPPNRFFGFKMSSVLPDTDAWYYANRILGLGTVVSGLITGVVSLILPAFVSEYDRGTRVAVVLIAVITPLLAAVMITRKAAVKRMHDE